MIQFNYFTILHSGIQSKIVLQFADFFFFCRLVDLCICVLLGVFVSLLYLSHFSDLLPVKLISCSPPPGLSF